MPEARHNLLCVLDWGLGHASRSLALARRLEAEGERISWASSGAAADMLRRELEGQVIHELPGYKVRYPSKKMAWNVARQLWHWQRTIRAEKKVTALLAERLGVDRIISDSRFGCYHKEIPSVMLTHQLHPITGFGPASSIYRLQLSYFDEYWVPDHPGHDRLSGKLSDPSGYENVHFLGPLPHLKAAEGEEPFELLALLSGPEPMRTRLEEILLPQLSSLPHTTRVVRGLPASSSVPVAAHGLDVLNFADTSRLSALLTAAHFVVARPGYSTLMDLRALGKKAILVPTPGQTEQEYLAQRAQLQGWAVAVMDQDKLDLSAALARLQRSSD